MQRVFPKKTPTKRHRGAIWCRILLASALFTASSNVYAQVYYSEDFESVKLGPPVDETIPDLPVDDPRDAVYSPTGPAGWSVDRSNTPTGGVTEFRGWNFLDPIWWSEVAGNQERTNFTVDQGNVIAVADGDEWDDKSHAPGLMNTVLSTPSIPLTGLASGINFAFDTSWRAEAPQVATLTARFNVGAPVELIRWESNEFTDEAGTIPNPNYQPDLNPDRISVPVAFPAGATSVAFDFGYSAGNNWWWAVDNIDFGNFSEDFEGVALGTNVDEGRVLDGNAIRFDPEKTFTHEGPAGWTAEHDIPGYDVEGQGRTEWKGWSFADKEFWALVAGDQNRTFFTKGQGNVAVADPDEWDDQSHDPGLFNSTITTPSIDITGAPANSLQLTFDSSWRDECCDDGDKTNNQTAVITATYGNGVTEEVMRWQSDDTLPFFKNDNENESVVIDLKNPAGANSVKLSFALLDAANDWWWAFDNVKVSGTSAGIVGDFNKNGQLDAGDIDELSAAVRAANNPAKYDVTGDNKVDEADRDMWVNTLRKTYFGDADLNGEFSSGDFVTVFSAGEYEDATAGNSGWAEGDWDGNGDFDSGDFVAAFSAGGYELGPRTAVSAVPEPASLTMIGLSGLALLPWLRRKK